MRSRALQQWGARIVCPHESLADTKFQASVKKNCRCLPPCGDVEYQWQTSSMKWPTDEVMVGYTGMYVHVPFPKLSTIQKGRPDLPMPKSFQGLTDPWAMCLQT